MYSIFNMYILLLLLAAVHELNGHDMKGFDDTILFNINWPGGDSNLNIRDAEDIILTTAYKEKYKCFLPNLQAKEPTVTGSYDGPSALELISPLFSQSSCSYRLESYWTYEVCHGRHIRQYHEEREGKKIKVQEYILGQWDKNYYEVLLDEMKLEEKENKDTPVPVKKIDGVSLPYLDVTMGNGTQCELNQNKPRQTKVIYVCYIHGKHEIFSLKETSTCVYEVVILSPLLCSHPRYKPHDSGESQINCLPLEGNPNKPRNLIKMKKDALKQRFKSDIERIRVELHPLDLNEKEEPPKPPETPVDTSPVENFLAGKNCLNGGTSWWKYEFCYGRYVEQFHVEKNGARTSINLGYFNKEKHLEWLNIHPHKRPKPVGQRTQLSHLYSGGSVCDKTGKPRQTEVKLKCLENAANVNAVSLYLLEPRFCEYILGVESPLICDILARTDENGLVPTTREEESTEEEISTVNVIRV